MSTQSHQRCQPPRRFGSRQGRVPAILVGLLVAGFSPSALADAAVLLPDQGDDGLQMERREALGAVARALQVQGLRVIPHADAMRAAAGSAGAECRALDCAPFLMRASKAGLAVAVAVWLDGRGARADAVSVTLVDLEGHRYPGQARIEAAGVSEAARRALIDARNLQGFGPGPWLRVYAKPDGSRVLLNGKPVGTTPYRGAISAGRHTVEVRRDGYRPHLQTVDVPPDEARQVEIAARLEPRESTTAPVRAELASPSEAASERPLVGPLVLGGAGLLLTVADVVFILDAGCASRGPTGVCREEDQLDDGAAIALGAVGVGAMVGAVLWYLVGAEDSGAAAVHLGRGSAVLAIQGRL